MNKSHIIQISQAQGIQKRDDIVSILGDQSTIIYVAYDTQFSLQIPDKKSRKLNQLTVYVSYVSWKGEEVSIRKVDNTLLNGSSLKMPASNTVITAADISLTFTTTGEDNPLSTAMVIGEHLLLTLL